MAMLKVTTNCVVGMPPIVPNTSATSVTSSWKMPMTHTPPVKRPQQSATITNHVASNNNKELQCQGYHFVDNATNGLDFGTNKHGINGCTHPGWERSFTNYRRAGILLPWMSSTR
jgi:hypothetical protein